MCGIAGIYDLRGGKVDPADLEIFTAILKHRGPDDKGTWHQNGIGLAHTRLSIIDLSSQGHQPMSNEDKTIWITFNGEIYNFMDLRGGLEERGHKFNSNTDTEVIIHLYEEKGMDCLDDLRGMFAFGLWDEKKQRLILARDRIGKKPLFYTIQENKVVFASELKAIAALPWIEKQLDLQSLAYVFSFDHVPWPRSIYQNIYKLPPSNYAIFDKENRGVIKKYWKLDLQKKESITEGQASEQLREMMKESIKLRLRSDVPLGMFLSGGIDSSFVVGLASQFVDRPIRTFSIGYHGRETKDPEFSYSREVSSHFNTLHHEILFDTEIVRHLPEIMYSYDEPFCIPNALAHYQLCKETRKEVTVTLSGDGGDEAFAGYDAYKKWKLLDWASILFPWRNSESSSAFQQWPNGKGPLWWKLLITPRPFRRGMAKQILHEGMVNSFFSRDKAEVLNLVNVGEILSKFYIEGHPREFLDGVLYVDLFINYAWSTTIASDISGMSNSLEVRSPFLDHKLVEFAFSLPAKMKLKGFDKEKYILYRAGAPFLPTSVLNRKKMSYGAGIPYKKLFFDEWMPFVRQIIFDEKVARLHLFNLPFVQKLLRNPECDARDFKNLWRVFCTSAWLINDK